jgi:anthranilate phosphoribosyltransferase
MEWPAVLSRITSGADLTRDEARQAMDVIMLGEATAAQTAAFIVALRMKGETVDEMTGLVEGMRAAAVTVDAGRPVVDTAGTGGDRLGTFNISTTAALVAAGAGAAVAKHGNRSASSRCGSADVLEALGVAIDLPPAAAVDLLAETGFTFFFAPALPPGPATRRPGPARAGHPDRLQLPGPALEPGGCHPAGDRGVRPGDGRADDRGAWPGWAPSTPSCTTARTGWTRSR